MDAVLLSRIQFGLTAGFHFIFPPLTLGLALLVVIIEFMYVRSDNVFYRTLSTFLSKILGLVFVMGVATGIVLEFSFGTNWSNYSRMVGDIFGAPLAAEGVFSFFMESVFLGILLFGREKVSKRVYLLSAILVCFASHLSGFWIIIANSWMQTPAGFAMVGGKAVLTDFFAAVFNPSTVPRFLHTIMGGWITGTLFTAGVSAWYLLKGRDTEYAKKLLSISLTVFIITAFAQFGAGHYHAIQVAKTQPPKMAAFEALWKTTTGAPMSIIGWPDPAEQKTHFEIAVPRLLSIGIDFDPNSTIPGLDAVNRDEWPPIVATYLSYHVMIGLGSLFALIALIGAFLMLRGTIANTRWYLWCLLCAIPLPFIGNEVGWMAAEFGRQPWAVWQILKTSNAASVVVPAEQILFTIIAFTLIYIFLFIIFIKLLLKLVRLGPEKISSGYQE